VTDLSDSDDRSLLARHVEGDPEAFGVLFTRHRDRLWGVALRTTANHEDAADALQDALVSAFRRASSYRGDAAVTTWLHRIVVNACLDRIRRQRVRAADPLPDDVEEYAATSRPGRVAPEDPLDSALVAERRSAVLEALATLPADQRAALVLVDMEGYSIDETAAILQCAPGTVKSRCSRGRGRLAPLLAAYRRPGNPEAPARVPPTSAPAGQPADLSAEVPCRGRPHRRVPEPGGGDPS
jgi:RNA polymerase sigma-70 factor, ECF subfamily